MFSNLKETIIANTMLGCRASDPCKDIFCVREHQSACEQEFASWNFLLPTLKPHIQRLTNDESRYVLDGKPGKTTLLVPTLGKEMNVCLTVFLKQRPRLVNGFPKAS